MGDTVNFQIKNWWRKPFSMLQASLREVDVNMDVDKVASYISQLGADAWLIGNELVAQRSSGDLIADAYAAASARGMRLLARSDFSTVSRKVAEEYPEWCYVSHAGELQRHTRGLRSVCPIAGYSQERIFDILNEVVRRYPSDGFFIQVDDYERGDHYKWYHGVCHCDSCQTRWCKYSGGNNAVGRELWHHATFKMISSWISFRPEVPVLANSACYMDMLYRMASEKPAHFAHKTTRFHKVWRAVYNGLQPTAKTGLVRPGRGHIIEKQYQALFHILFDNIAQEHVVAMTENQSLKMYQVVIRLNLGFIQSDTVAVLDKWVLIGGHLVTTVSSSIKEDGSVQLNLLPVSHRLALDGKREQRWSSYLALPQTSVHSHIYTGTYGNIQVEQRGYGTGSFSRGKGVVIPFIVWTGYRDLEGGAKDVLPCRIVDEAEMTVNRTGSKVVVHLINMSGAKRQNFGSHIPVSGGIRTRGE
ncbi:hypothetical protein BJX62DRAFT_228944 [Aspergillus germanicus]